MTGAGHEAPSGPLLGPDEPPPFEVINAGAGGHVVLVCDHASNRIPVALGTLGLDPAHLTDHIAWDPGAADVARRLAEDLDAPLVLSGYSRLVVDCNRRPDSPQSVPEHSAGVTVPGNRDLTDGQRRQRLESLFHPYHAAIDRLLDAHLQEPTLLISIHSFTPVLHGSSRPWHMGLAPGGDRRLADLLRAALARGEDLNIGYDEPYPIDRDNDYTIPVHGDGNELPCVMIEIRQDGVRTPAQAAAWAGRLAEAYHSSVQPALCPAQKRNRPV